MKKLEAEIKKNGFMYCLVMRGEKAFIYSQKNTMQEEPIAFEVFKRKIQKAGKMKVGDTVVEFEEKERFPSNEDFGKWAWTYKKFDKAMEKYSKLNSVVVKE